MKQRERDNESGKAPSQRKGGGTGRFSHVSGDAPSCLPRFQTIGRGHWGEHFPSPSQLLFYQPPATAPGPQSDPLHGRPGEVVFSARLSPGGWRGEAVPLHERRGRCRPLSPTCRQLAREPSPPCSGKRHLRSEVNRHHQTNHSACSLQNSVPCFEQESFKYRYFENSRTTSHFEEFFPFYFL